MRWGLPLAALVFPVLAAPTAEYLSVRHKLDLIESDTLRPGSRVTLSARELNAYVANSVTDFGLQGVRNPRVELGEGTASGSALIDFVKVRQAAGEPPGWILSKLLAGERPVRVTAQVVSGAGRATVNLQRVEISGVAIEGKALEFLIDNFVMPKFPDAKVGQPFELAHRIERLEVKPAAVGVVVGK